MDKNEVLRLAQIGLEELIDEATGNGNSKEWLDKQASPVRTRRG